MSGITQLVAIGSQDTYLVGNPTISFFRSTYSHHTNFSQVVHRQVIQGNPASGGMSTIRFERKGDLLGYTYFTVKDNDDGVAQTITASMIDQVEILIGGQVVDTQDYTFSTQVAPYTTASTFSKANTSDGLFYPLRFWFCENAQSYLPLVALQYHDVELRIRWGDTFPTAHTVECWSNFVYLDNDERKMIADSSHEMLMYQVQKTVASNTKVQELNLNHPVKFLAAAESITGSPTSSRLKLQLNGVDVSDYKTITPHFNLVPLFYNTSFSSFHYTALVPVEGRGQPPAPGVKDSTLFLIPFCLDTNKLQPSGALNFSRLDSARIVSETDSIENSIYAVNYNILKIVNGMGGMMFAN